MLLAISMIDAISPRQLMLSSFLRRHAISEGLRHSAAAAAPALLRCSLIFMLLLMLLRCALLRDIDKMLLRCTIMPHMMLMLLRCFDDA